MFDLFMEDRESAELCIEQTMYEAGTLAEGFTKKVRGACARTGKSQGYYWGASDRYFNSILKDMESQGRDAIKAMIREVMEEGDSEEPSEVEELAAV